MATNAAAVAMAMMNCGGGGSGGDVTKAYVDEHLALKADKFETQQYPISGSTTGVNPTITDSADGYVQGLTVYGRSEVVEGEIVSIGSAGELAITTCGDNLLDLTALEAGTIDQKSGQPISDFADTTSRSPFIGVHQGSYYLSITGTVRVFKYGMNNTYLENELYTNVITVDSTVNSIRIQTANNTWATATQLKRGSTATAYEPYISSTATLATGLPLYSVGDVKDELDEKRGVVIKRCEKVVLDGSEDWTAEDHSIPSATGSKRCVIYEKTDKYIAIMGSTEIAHAICDNLQITNADITYGGSIDDVISLRSIDFSGDIRMQICLRIASISTAADLKTYLASNPVTAVYELAEPYEIPLNASELAQLRDLKTYAPITNVTVTDDPTVDVGYLLNTDNGQAVADVQTGLQEQIIAIPAFIASIPEMHRNILRGKYLGSAVSAAQLAAIADGSFDDLYVGDYWTINNTVYRIADMDFFRTDANSPFLFTTHHLVIVPDGTMYKAKMNNNSATTSGGYKNSDMRTTNLSAAKTTINADFPDMVLTYKDLLVTATSSGMPTASDYFDCDIELMSETMLFGGYVNAKPSNPPYFCAPTNPTQIALFRLDPQFIITDRSETIWLRDAADGAMFCTMEYSPFGRGANYADGAVRPFFLIGDAT